MVRALQACGREATGPQPDRPGKLGSKRHILTDACGVPLAIW